MKRSKDGAEILADEGRQSISSYCFSECKAYCCRKGLLELSSKEATLVTNGKKEKLKRENILTTTAGGRYILNLGALGQACPSLREYKCAIYYNPARPETCRKFPIFIFQNKSIRISQRCPAAREGLLYPYIVRFNLMGYKQV